MNLAGLFALLAGAPAIFAFVYRYGSRSNWRLYPVGRALMYFAVSLGLTYVWIIVRLSLALTGHDTEALFVWQCVRIVLFSAISATLWRLLFVLLKVQREDPDQFTPDLPS